MLICLAEYLGHWKSSFQWIFFAKSSLCLRIQTQVASILGELPHPIHFPVFSVSGLSLLLATKMQKNSRHKSNNSCPSVSEFQLLKASSKLIQPLCYLTTGLLMKLIGIAGIPNTVVTMEISAAAYISYCAKHPLSHCRGLTPTSS